MEYSRSSPLFLLSFSFLLLLSRLSSFSAQPPVPAREPERPGVEWHKRKRKGEKREGRKESGERSRGRSETETAKPPINFSLTTISTHNFPSLHLSRRKSPRLHHLLSLSLLIARVSLRENKNWTREDWFGERSKKRDSVQLRCNLISTEWWWKKMEWWGKWRGEGIHLKSLGEMAAIILPGRPFLNNSIVQLSPGKWVSKRCLSIREQGGASCGARPASREKLIYKRNGRGNWTSKCPLKTLCAFITQFSMLLREGFTPFDVGYRPPPFCATTAGPQIVNHP